MFLFRKFTAKKTLAFAIQIHYSFLHCKNTRDFSIKQIFMREFSVIKQNILQFIERQDISKYELYKKTGISNGTLSQKGGMSEENIIKFLSVYREVSAEWLLTGKGEMLKSSIQNIVQNSGKNSINNISGNIEQQNYNELMEIIREKDRQIAKKDEQINKLIEKLIN